MNPSLPSTNDMQHIEQLFFKQMQRSTRMSTDPVMQTRAKLQASKSQAQRMREHHFLRSFDFQFSDQWLNA